MTPTVPLPPSSFREDATWWLRITARRAAIHLIIFFTRPCCGRCGRREVYSWSGDRWPRGWRCQPCAWRDADEWTAAVMRMWPE